MEERRSIAELLRETAGRLEKSSSSIPSSTSSSFAAPRHPVDAEVARLFSPYRGQTTQHQTSRNSRSTSFTYTHNFCCLGEKNKCLVPSKAEKDDLSRAGLGEKRLTLKGKTA